MADLQDRKRRRQAKSAKEIKALMPKNRSYSHSKRHTEEPLQDFRDRRKKTNRQKKNPLYKKF